MTSDPRTGTHNHDAEAAMFTPAGARLHKGDKIVLAMIAFGLALAVAGAVFAAEPDRPGPRWQIWVQRAGQDWSPLVTKRGHIAPLLASATACNLDLASAANAEPSGTMLVCRRVVR